MTGGREVVRVEPWREVGAMGGRGAEGWVDFGVVEGGMEEPVGMVDVEGVEVGVAEVEGGMEEEEGEVEAVTVTMGETTIRVVDAATPVFG